MKIAIIAAYNEEDTIGTIVIKTKKHVDKVIVVDDGSKDKTAEVAQVAGAMVIQHTPNGGKGMALKTGFEAAGSLHPDVLVCLDADAQHDPDEIPKVIAPILSGEAEMVIASRYIKKEHTKNVPRYRRLGLWVLTKAMNFGSECKVTDTQCGFRAFSGDVIGTFRFEQTGLSIESEMLDDAIANNLTIKEVAFEPKYEVANANSERPAKHGFSVLNFILRSVKERHPLLFFGLTGMVLLIMGLAFGVYCIDTFIRSNFIPLGPSLAASVFTIVGTLSLFTGLILSSISGMIQGRTQSSRSREEPLLDDTDEITIRRKILPSHPRTDTLPSNFNNNNIPGLTALNIPGGDMLLGNINGNNIPGLTVMDNNRGARLYGNINGGNNPGLMGLSNHGGDMLYGSINGYNPSGPAAMNNQWEETLPDNFDDNDIPGLAKLSSQGGGVEAKDIDEQRITEPVAINNHRGALLLEDIDENKIHM